MTNPFGSRFGTLVCFGWEGTHPGTGKPYPFLGLTSPADGSNGPGAARRALAAFAKAVGINPQAGTMTEQVPNLDVLVRRDGWLALTSDGETVVERPSGAEWDRLAKASRQCALMIGYLPMRPGVSDMDYIDQVAGVGQYSLALLDVRFESWPS